MQTHYQTGRWQKRVTLGAIVLCSALVPACARLRDRTLNSAPQSGETYYAPEQTRIEYPSVKSYLEPEVVQTPPPLALENPAELPTRDIELNEAIQLALSNAEILRSLGGSVVQAPAGVRTKFDPAVTESNPIGGVEAALSAFDAQVASQLFWNVNDRPNNIQLNPILGQFQVPTFQQTAATFNYEIAKRTATGARFAARHVFNYDNANTPNRLFSGAYTGWFEFEYRQPLLRGAGVDFNRIAGPNSGVGQYNGVLIARINTDISLADFEAGVISFINDVETAYWELYFAYHNLESLVAGRNAALVTWQRTKELQRVGARGGDAAAEAQARSNYYNFDVQVKDALTGPNGLYAIEQRLRYLLGLPATDGMILKPITEPMDGQVAYDWNAALQDALTQRVEIRRQKWNIKRRELELIAAKMNRLPNLDFLGLYRYRGLGDALIDSRDPNNSFNSLYQSIFEGDYQEWQAGLELSYPVGLRQAGVAVANARWNLARECALLKEQELKISHDLANAARQVRRAYELLVANYNRQLSDQEQVKALQARYESGLDNINFLLQAQQQLAASQSAFFRSLVDYQLALRDFHREKGSLLAYNHIGLAEDAWPTAAYADAAERGQFFTPRVEAEAVEVKPAHRVSDGAFDPTTIGHPSDHR
ncbi:MAG: secretion protein [Pirellulaceae bacterium]|nr:MAG: secretion protein [Pirellulaceae bacterium]